MSRERSIRTCVAVTLVAAAICAGCQTTPTQQGAVAGAAIGSAAGAIIGHQQGKQGEGALIGAAAGALGGALIGDQVDERRDRQARTRQQVVVPTESAPRGHWEMRTLTAPSGEKYEDRVWVSGG